MPVTQATSLDIEGSYAALGGLKGDAAVYSIDADSVERQLAIGEPVTDTLWTGSRVIFATSQGSVKVYENGSETGSLTEHSGAATGLSIHPGGDILGSVGADKAVIFYSLSEMKRVSRAYTDACKSPPSYQALIACALLIFPSTDCLCLPSRRPHFRRRHNLRRS